MGTYTFNIDAGTAEWLREMLTTFQQNGVVEWISIDEEPIKEMLEVLAV